jgi:hypothetical protein
MSRVLLLVALILATTALAGDGWTTYRGDGFSIRVPPGWTVNGKFVDYGYGYYQGGADDEVPGVAFRPRTDPQPRSNLREPYPYLAVQRLPAGGKCVADAFIVDPPPDSFTEEPVDAANFAATLARPGDLYTIEQQVFVVSTAPCMAAHIYMVYTQTRDRTEEPMDRERLSALFARMRRTVVVRIP